MTVHSSPPTHTPAVTSPTLMSMHPLTLVQCYPLTLRCCMLTVQVVKYANSLPKQESPDPIFGPLIKR